MSSYLYSLVFIVSAILIPPAHAHDYWFEAEADHYRLHRGHLFSGHDGEKEVPFNPASIQSAHCLKAQAAEATSADVSGDYPALISGPCVTVLAIVDSGYWSQTLTGTRNLPKDEVFGALRSWHALETIKRVDAWSERLLSPLTDELELVFTGNPFKLSDGDKLRLIAMRGGKPAAGVAFAYDGKPRGLTGEDGRIVLRIRHAGTQTIMASIEEPIENNEEMKLAEKRTYSTILTFDIDRQ
jgi:nickel transport protein